MREVQRIILSVTLGTVALVTAEQQCHAWGWIPADGQASAGPAAVLVPGAGNRVDLFVRGLDSNLWHRTLDDNTFTASWDASAGGPPGGLSSRPAALYQPTSPGGDRWHVVGLAGSSLYYTYYQASAGGWHSPWIQLPNGTLDRGASLTLNFDNSVHVWTASGSPKRIVWHTWILADGSTPTTPGVWDASVGAPTSPLGVRGAPTAFSRAANEFDIVVQSADDSMLWHRNWNGSSWSSWKRLSQLSDTVVIEPALTSTASGQLDVYARGSGGVLYHTSFTTRQPPTTATWDTEPGVPSNPGPVAAQSLMAGYGVAAVATPTGAVDLFGVDTTQTIYMRRFNRKWRRVPATFPTGVGPQTLNLMMDGSVMASDAAAPHTKWYRFQPSASSGYLGGAWEQVASSPLGRAAFVAALLKDGRLLAGGGEYVFQPNGTQVATNGVNSPFHNQFEIFDPRANTWMSTPPYPLTNGTGYFADGVTAPMPNGRVLVGSPSPPAGDQSMEFDHTQCPPGQSTCTATPWVVNRTLPAPVGFAEGSLALMQNDNVFVAANSNAQYQTGAQQWTGPLAVPPNNPFGNPTPSIPNSGSEGGSALTLYDGRVLILGGSAFNSIFTPGSGTNVNVASLPSVFPSTLATSSCENGQSLLPTGNALVLGNADGYERLWEYQPAVDLFVDASVGGPDYVTGVTKPNAVVQTLLPDGSVLVGGENFSDLYIYAPSEAQLTSSGQPTLSTLSGPSSGVYTLSGTTLNGLTNGNNRDDEGANFTSFPLVSITAAGLTLYCDVTDVSTRSIAPGASVTVKFKLPATSKWPSSWPKPPQHGSFTVRVSASGLKSSNSKTLSY